MFKMTTPLIVLILMAVFLFLAATNIQGGWLYLVDAFLWSIVLCAMLFPFLQLRRLRIQRHYAFHVIAGQPFMVTLNCDNPGQLAVSFLRLQDELPKRIFKVAQLPVIVEQSHGFIVSLSPGQSYSYQYQLTCQQRGVYQFEQLKVGSFGPLGLLGLYRHVKQTSAVVVKPMRPTLNAQQLAFQQLSEQSAQMRQKKSLAFQSISHFRDYQPGDNRRWIHWKNSAKQNKLIVWESREESVYRALMVVDTSISQAIGFEPRIQLAGSLALYFLEHQYELSLYAQASDSPVWQQVLGQVPQRSLESPGHWNEIATWLALLEPDSQQSLVSLLLRGSKLLRTQWVVITGQPTVVMLNELEKLCRESQSLATVFYTETLPAQRLPALNLVQLKAWVASDKQG